MLTKRITHENAAREDKSTCLLDMRTVDEGGEVLGTLFATSSLIDPTLHKSFTRA